mgnify:CR=1 FL=1
MNRMIVVLVVIFVVALTAVPVMAARPMNVHIEAPSTIDPTIDDPFTASGPAVDSGLLCASGSIIYLGGQVSGPPDGSFINLKALKHFVCDDGSGTIDVKLVAHVDKVSGEATGRWVVTGGTGDYSRLHGSGKLIGIPMDLGVTILDIYDGRMH